MNTVCAQIILSVIVLSRPGRWGDVLLPTGFHWSAGGRAHLIFQQVSQTSSQSSNNSAQKNNCKIIFLQLSY